MSEVHGAVGSYVANALDPDERTLFEQHLRVCPACRREVEEFRETAAELSVLAQATPPPELRSSVLSAIRQVRPLPPPPPAETPINAPVEPGRGSGTDELALRRGRRVGRMAAMAVAAAMTVAVALGGWVVAYRAQQSQTASAQLETQLLSAPDARVYTAVVGNRGHGSFVVSKSLGEAMFVSADIASPGEDKVYKLWTISGNAPPVPDVAFDGGGPEKVWLSGPVSGASHLAITVEQDPDVTTPSGEPVVVELS